MFQSPASRILNALRTFPTQAPAYFRFAHEEKPFAASAQHD